MYTCTFRQVNQLKTIFKKNALANSNTMIECYRHVNSHVPLSMQINAKHVNALAAVIVNLWMVNPNLYFNIDFVCV